MQRFYSQTTGNTYLQGIHKDMPADAVKMSEALYMEVIGNPPRDKVRAHGADGLPCLIDAPVDLAEQERSWRTQVLATNEWLVTRHRDELGMGQATTLTAEQFEALLVYRQQLRDWPAAEEFPDSSRRPDSPSWLSEQIQ